MITDEIKIRTAFVLNVLSKSEMPVCFFRFERGASEGQGLHELSVSLIYCCLAAGLIKVVPGDWLESNDVAGIENYAELLLSINPDAEILRDDITTHDYAVKIAVWMDAQIECTPNGDELVSSCFPGGFHSDDVESARYFGID
ncbi:hypothetical protein [Xanthomonas oryzae]|uniref:hypothetical protein n=1 Tax=Xanthomonas oryzae TaxID=347 RepID=UPI001034C7A5|nr:hypothetical protein [Xanthomonas oryzae]QBH01637.1 hypothetical protein EYC56_23455 [Xanthomonas oryzae]